MFPKNGLTAYAGLGWLFHNQQYFARPDNTGRALFRYVAHFDLDLYKQKLVLFGDVNMFTDRERRILSTHPSWTGSSASPCAGATSS